MAGPTTLFQSGNHAARPAASSGCTLYWCTDHEIVYRSDGSAWANWLDLSAFSGTGIPETLLDAKGDLIVASAADTAARLAVGGDGDYPRAASGASVGIEWQKNNLAASTAPTANEDSGDGYSVGSRWIDTTNDKEYVCLDATVGAAVWTETTGGGSGVTGSTVELATDVVVPNTGAVTDILSISLAAGTWFVIGKVVTGHADASNAFATRLTDGTTDFDSCQHPSGGIRGDVSCVLVAQITLGSTTTVKIQGKANAAYTAVGAASAGVNYLGTKVPTRIQALKIA